MSVRGSRLRRARKCPFRESSRSRHEVVTKRGLQRRQPLGMLAHEARHPAQVPPRVPRQEAAVDHRRVVVRDDGRRHVPALPPRLAARGTRGRCPRRSGGSRRPSRRARRASRGASAGTRRAASRPAPGSVGPLVEVVVRRAARTSREQAERRPAHERAAHRREAAARRLPASVGPAQLRARDPGARVRLEELAQRLATASGSGTASGFATSTSSPLVAAMPWLTFAANVRGARSEHARVHGLAAHAPGRFSTRTSSSTCGRRSGTSRSTSSAWPCETTTRRDAHASSSR